MAEWDIKPTGEDLERADKILHHNLYKECVKKIRKCEEDRIFCTHQPEHYMDVARIAWILNLEEGYDIPKDIIYATALLHDIGRYRQYEDNTPHEDASAILAPGILAFAGYNREEREMICSAIRTHRNYREAQKNPLNDIIYRADKASRACYLCTAVDECDRKPEKMNKKLRG